jgi:hypothetical protein
LPPRIQVHPASLRLALPLLPIKTVPLLLLVVLPLHQLLGGLYLEAAQAVALLADSHLEPTNYSIDFTSMCVYYFSIAINN